MITLFTGRPGHGKTLYVVSRLLELFGGGENGRPLYVDGIKGLRVPHQTIDGRNWQAVPDGSLVVIDEAQRIFPTRGAGTPPEHVAALATHRHRGIDIWLITQHPGNIDSFVRERLVEEHIHVVRMMGFESAIVYKWQEVQTDPRSQSAIDASLQTPWTYPKGVYGQYESAVLHTAKARWPVRKLATIIGGIIAVPALLYGALVLMPGREAVDAAESAPQETTPQGTPAVPAITTADQWLARFTPRVEYRPESAPAYDGYMTQAEPPRIVCVDAELRGCRCYTEQATPWAGVTEQTCKRLARQGSYVYRTGRG